ncbi:MAG: hypothetical protein IH588_05390 [Anaerolineales bacterium]|nr:hypothetical protein [Anaerolineales bacterium]
MILDHVENLEFNADDEDYLFDAEMTLARLSQGLFWLDNSVRQAENLVRKKAIKENIVLSVLDEPLNSAPADWISCAFQWYAVSAYNYVRLVGWLATKDTKFTDDYVKRVMPKVVEYRHKVAAHFALTAPRKDNAADLVSSVMTNIIYAHGYLRAGAMSEILVDKSGGELLTKNKTSWSLTKTHDKLVHRYWPSGPLKTYQAFKVSAGSTRKFSFDWED